MRNRNYRVVGVVGIVLTLSFPRASQGLKLRYQWKTGLQTTCRSSVAAAAMVQMPFMEESLKMQMRGALTFHQKVTKVDTDGIAEIENRIEPSTFSMSANGGNEKMPFPGETTVLRMSPRGKVLSISNVASGEESEETEESPHAKGLDANQVFRNGAGLVFPEEDLKPGQTWTEECTLPVGPEQSVKIKCNGKLIDLVEVQGMKCAKLEATIVFPLALDFPGERSSMPSDVAADSQGYTRLTSTIYFDYEQGIVVFSEGSITGAMQYSMSPPPGAVEAGVEGTDMSMSMKLKMNVKTTLQKGARTR
ncbi:MAG: hypothetical protein HY318_12910 [Armatimonadetes bacterium]|nr:hypothetical protein [Armatimonadota bacterium]